MTGPLLNADVTVVGSGIIGMATAFELLERGLKVTVIAGKGGQHAGVASRAAGAMLTVFSEVERSHSRERVALEVSERMAARGAYEAWLERISVASNRRLTLVPGVWVIANGNGEDHRELEAIAAAARAHGQSAEFAPARDVPGLAPQVRAYEALWLPYEASIDPVALLEALSVALQDNPHCAWIDAGAVAVRDHGPHMAVETSDGRRALSAHVVLSAGAGIRKILAASDLGAQLAVPPLLSGRGVSLLLRTQFSLPSAVRTPNRGFACGSHMVPRSDGSIYLGATNRLSTEPDYDALPTLDEIATLIHQGAAELNVALRQASLLSVRVGHRPVTIDHLPLLGATTNPTVHLATGTYRCGILLAPRAASLVTEGIIAPEKSPQHPYSPRREMRAPRLADLVESASRGLVELICQPGGTLPPGNEERLAAFFRAALLELAEEGTTSSAVAKRLWGKSPMEECVPLIMEAVGRLR